MSRKVAPAGLVPREIPRLTRTAWIFPREEFAFAIPAPVTAVELRLQSRFQALAGTPRAVQGVLSGGHGRLWFPPTKHSLPDLRFEILAEGGKTALRGAVGVPVREQVIAVGVGCAFFLGSALALMRPHGAVPAALAAVVGALALGGTRRVVVRHPYESRVLVSLLNAAALDEPWSPPPRAT